MNIPPTIEVASLGMWDSLILMVMALVVFGPRRLPEIGRQLGKLMYEFRKASNDFKFQIEEELRVAEASDRLKKEDEQRQALALTAPADTVAASDSPYPGEDHYPSVDSEAAPETSVSETEETVLPDSSDSEVVASTAEHEPEKPAVTPEDPSAEQVNHHA